MNRDQKSAVVEEIAGELQDAQAIFAVDYRGISVAQVADLRAKLRDADARFRVVKNSLSERAADQAGMDTLKPLLIGPTALAFVKGDAALAAKALNDVARQLNLLDFKGGVMNGSALSADDVRSIARLPSREVLNAQLVGTIASPLTGLVRTLNALIAGLAIQLQAIADMDPPVLVSGEAPAAAPEAEVPAAEEAAPEADAEAAASEPEAEPAPEPEATAEAAPEPEAEAAPEPEPEAEVAPEPEPEAAPEPEAEAPTDTTDETQAASDAAPSDE
ncbi:MAG TPA: 50S ribosomal protein L10 [Solirubrobacteraceae bacterium]|nr:50S ribosomal protein L10 [Solirubrobacteraceae bacterium]